MGSDPSDGGREPRFERAGKPAGPSLEQSHSLTPQNCPPLRHAPLVGVLRSMLEFAGQRDYEGWDHRDGPNSLIRSLVPLPSRALDGAARSVLGRASAPARRLAGVRPRRTPAGAALFGLANLGLQRLDDDLNGVAAERAPAYEARRLAQWIVHNDLDDTAGFCVGHGHGFDADGDHFERGTPSVRGTRLGVAALTAGQRVVSDWPDRWASVASSAERFVLDDLNYRTWGNRALVDAPDAPNRAASPVHVAECAHLLLELYAAGSDEELLTRAKALLDTVATHQRPSGGWRDRHATPVPGHDVGSVVGAFVRHREVAAGGRYSETLSDALGYYRDSLFEENGAPRWSAGQRYPRDVRSAAEGILTFARTGSFDVAGRLIGWLLRSLYDPRAARVYHRRGRIRTDRTTLMEWGQGWASYALSEYLLRLTRHHDGPDSLLTDRPE